MTSVFMRFSSRTSHVFRQIARGQSSIINFGFVGLGNMGGSMSINLAKKGHSVTLCDLNQAAIEQVRSRAPECKFSSVNSIDKLLDDQKIQAVVLVLPESAHVASALGQPGQSGLLKQSRKDLLFMDCTTGDINAAQSLSKVVTSTGSRYLDAPISGGVMAAKDGTLTFMVGAPDAGSFQLAKPVLECMGKKIFHCGEVGTGLAAKICNNMLLAISMIGTAEAMALGQNLGLDAKTLAEIINCSSGRCWSSEVYNPVPGVLPNVPASKAYQGGFGSHLMAKDLGLAQNAGTMSKSSIPLGSMAHQLYRMLAQTEHARKDFSVIYEMLKKMQS